jgi:tape measure domain-containing protein
MAPTPASGVELGTYYVSVTTSAKGLFKELNGAGATAADASGKKAGETYAQSYAKTASSKVGELLSKYGPAALAGVVAFKGIDRLLDIDSAKSSLKGLGNSTTQVAAIMKDALNSVKGTAFSLGDAAGVAATAVASGVTAGSALTDYLKLTADTATIAQAPLNEIGDIFNGISAKGKVYTDDLNQLASRNIPVFQYLQKQYGVTGEALTKMVESGQVDSATFFKAIQTNIGGAALTAGGDIKGTFDNLEASLGRIGANVLGGGADKLPALFTDITHSLEPVESAASVVGDALGGAVTVAKAIPGPVLAGAAAFAILLKVSSPLKGALETGALKALYLGDSLRTAQAEAASMGSRLPALAGGLNLVTKAGKTAGSAILGAVGGPAGLAVTAGVTAVTFAISAWTDATAKQQEATDRLSDSLDSNTGAVTSTTLTTIFDDLKAAGSGNAIDALETLGLNTKSYIAAISTGGPALAAYRQQLLDIGAAAQIENDKQDPATYRDSALRADAASIALKGLDAETKSLGNSTADYAQKARAGVVDTTNLGNAAGGAAAKVKTFGDKVDTAFNRVGNLGKQRTAIEALGTSIANNGKVVSSSTAKGVANAGALEDAVSAMAAAAGKNQNQFAANVIGLIRTLRARGVDVSGVLGAVRKSLVSVAGTKWAVYLDGSQSVAEAVRVVKANLAAAKSFYALAQADTSQHSESRQAAALRSIADLNSQLSALNAIRAAATSTGAAISAGAAAGNSAANAGATKVASTAKAVKTTADYLKAIVTAAKGLQNADNEATAAAALRVAIKQAAVAHKISSSTKSRLLAEEQDTSAKLKKIIASRAALAGKIDDANNALQAAISQRDEFKSSVIDGYKQLGDLGKLASQTEAAVTTYTRIGDTIFGSTADTAKAASADTLIARLKDQVEQAKEFRTAYDALAAEGLNSDALKSLASGFASSGDASLAGSLFGGGQTAIDQINALQAQLAGLGTSLGTDASTALFQPGVDLAQGLLDGLKSQDGALKKAYDKLADDLVAEVKKKLGIHSPSKKMAWIAEMTSKGFNDNLHFDPIAPLVDADTGEFQRLSAVAPVYLAQTNHYAYTETEAERVNTGLQLAKASFNY